MVWFDDQLDRSHSHDGSHPVMHHLLEHQLQSWHFAADKLNDLIHLNGTIVYTDSGKDLKQNHLNNQLHEDSQWSSQVSSHPSESSVTYVTVVCTATRVT